MDVKEGIMVSPLENINDLDLWLIIANHYKQFPYKFFRIQKVDLVFRVEFIIDEIDEKEEKLILMYDFETDTPIVSGTSSVLKNLSPATIEKHKQYFKDLVYKYSIKNYLAK